MLNNQKSLPDQWLSNDRKCMQFFRIVIPYIGDSRFKIMRGQGAGYFDPTRWAKNNDGCELWIEMSALVE
jgi:hypothetical protein